MARRDNTGDPFEALERAKAEGIVEGEEHKLDEVSASDLAAPLVVRGGSPFNKNEPRVEQPLPILPKPRKENPETVETKGVKESSFSSPEKESLDFETIRFEVSTKVPDLILFLKAEQVFGYAVLINNKWIVKAPPERFQAVCNLVPIVINEERSAQWEQGILDQLNSLKVTKK